MTSPEPKGSEPPTIMPNSQDVPKLSSIPDEFANVHFDTMNSHPPQGISEYDPIRVKLVVNISSAPDVLQNGLDEIIANHPVPYFWKPDDPPDQAILWHVRFVHSEDMGSSLEVSQETDGSQVAGAHQAGDESNGTTYSGNPVQIIVHFNRPIEAYRGLGHVLTTARTTEVNDPGSLVNLKIFVREQAKFETLGLMIDCSRNGVLTVSSIFEMLRYMALSGINMLQLYTEDTYKVPGELFFGYLRGGYTKEEIKQVDDYAFSLGIEVIPCIQTLGHLGQILQWPYYMSIRDTHEVVLCKSEETYQFLEKLITHISSCVRSKRIHIGMDESYGIGEGRFKQLFGNQDGAEIFVQHLQRLNQICQNLGLKPMIWSDMLFCLAAKNNALYAYYDQNNNPADLDKMRGMPSNVDLVFWNYYHTIPEIYELKLEQHRELGCDNPWMAGAAWTWSRMWCSLPFSFESNRASLIASKHPTKGVKNFMLTLWGDEGNECDFFSSLPVLLYVGHQGYTDATEIDINFMENSFAAICGGELEEWIKCSRLDEPPTANPMEVRPQIPSNMSKWLLWEDPMLAFMGPQYANYNLEPHFREIANQALYKAHTASASSQSRYPLNKLLRLPGLLARVLSFKCHLRDDLASAYRENNRKKLLDIARNRIQALLEAERELWLFHRTRWHRIYKPFGWEVLELRYGGLTARLQTLYDRVVSYALRANIKDLGYSRALGVTAGLAQLMDGTWTPDEFAMSGERSTKADLEAGHGKSDGDEALAPQLSKESYTMDVDSENNDEDPGMKIDTDLSAYDSMTITLGGKGVSKSISFENLSPSQLMPILANAQQTATPVKPFVVKKYTGQNHDHDVIIDSLPELEEDLHCVYPNAGMSLTIEYGRVTTPSRLG